MKPLSLFGIAVVAVICAASLAPGEIPRIDPKQDGLQAVLDRIHEHAGGDHWKQAAFVDEPIEKWFDKVIAMVAKAAEFPELRLPVRFSEVAPRDAAAGRYFENLLIIGRDIDLKDVTVRSSIILADGNIQINRIESSLLVARGAVTIHGVSNASVIAAGAYVKLGLLDGTPRDTTNGSLVLSRGWADVTTAHGTLIAAPEGIAVGRSDNAVFLNAPVPMPAGNGLPAMRDNGSRSVTVAELPLEALPTTSVASRFTILSVLHAQRAAPAPFPGRTEQAFAPRGIVFRFEDRTHVAELGEPIVDEEGRAVESLRDWRLSCVNSRFALLVGPESNAVIRFAKP